MGKYLSFFKPSCQSVSIIICTKKNHYYLLINAFVRGKVHSPSHTQTRQDQFEILLKDTITCGQEP